MSVVAITELLEGAANVVADVNSTLTSWETVSADIDGRNIREEGIERRNIEYASITPGAYRHRYNTNDRTAVIQQSEHGNVPVILGFQVAGTSGGTGADPSIGIGPIVFDNAGDPGAVAILRFSTEFVVDSTVDSSHARLNLRLGFFNGILLNTSQFTAITETFRSVQGGKNGNNPTSVQYRGSLTISHRFNPNPTLTTSTLFFGVLVNMAATNGGNQGARLRNACLSFQTFRR